MHLRQCLTVFQHHHLQILPTRCLQNVLRDRECGLQRLPQLGMWIENVYPVTISLSTSQYRNICAQEWVRTNPQGTTDDFKLYYDNLSDEQRQVRLYPYILLLHIFILLTGLGRKIKSYFVADIISKAVSWSLQLFGSVHCVSLTNILLHKHHLSQYNSIWFLLLLVEYDWFRWNYNLFDQMHLFLVRSELIKPGGWAFLVHSD